MLRGNWTELKARFSTYVWGIGYTLLAGVVTFLLSNIDLVQQFFVDNLDTQYQMMAFSLFVLLLQQIGKWLRNKGLMPLVEDKQKTV